MSATATALAPWRPDSSSSRSEYRRRTKGYTPLYHEQGFYELNRLTNGKTQLLILLFLYSETVGAERDSRLPPPEWSRPLRVREISNFAAGVTESDIRNTRLAVDDLLKRHVIEAKAKGAPGAHTYSLPTSTWPLLPGYEPRRKPVAAAEEIEPETKGEEDGSTLPERFSIPPVKVPDGRTSRPFDAPDGGRYRFRARGADVEIGMRIAGDNHLIDVRVSEHSAQALPSGAVVKATGAISAPPTKRNGSSKLDDVMAGI